MSKNKKIIIVVLAIISIICVTAGVTWAFLSYTKEGEKENTITSGAITFHYNEDSQGISLDNALPMSDNDGKSQNKYFDFTITSNNNMEATIPYTITARKVSDPLVELDEEYVKVYLTKVTTVNNTDSENQVLFDTYNNLSTVTKNNHSEEILWVDSVSANTINYTQKYRLRIWISNQLDFSPLKDNNGDYIEENGDYVYPNNNKEFSIKLNVYSEALQGARSTAGLYNANNKLIYTWQELINNNLITVTDGIVSAGTDGSRNNKLSGKLVIDNSITSIDEYAFSNCSHLTSVEFENGSQLTSIGRQAFYQCFDMESIEIPASVTSIGYSAFSGCWRLTSIEIPASVTDIGGSAFYGCTNLASIVIDSGNTIYDSRNNSNAIIKTETNELILGCKNTIIPYGVTKIGSQAFYNCSGLTSIEIPSSVTDIGQYAFASCSDLTSIEIPSSVTNIGSNAFDGINTIYYSGSAANSPWGAGQVISNY